MQRIKSFWKIIKIIIKIGPQKVLGKIENFSVDPLTGLSNRRALEEKREGMLSLAFIDFDDFKKINDTMGYKTGDRALTEFANILKIGSRKDDVFIRWGGDEFIIILPDTEEKEAKIIIERVRKKSKELSPPLEFSVGIVENKGERNLSVLIKEASERMQGDKKKRKAKR
jgi:diguanylate cyclase (GGDEF)-like protein